MMKSEFLDCLHAIPGHENDTIMGEDYALVEYVYAWHPSIPEVGGKKVIASLYAAGGMLVMRDMLPRASKAEETDKTVREIRRDISGMERRISDLLAGVMA